MALCLMLSGALLVWGALHPFSTYPVSLVLLRMLSISTRVRTRSANEGRAAANVKAPTSRDVAICMCAYNEERVIESKLENLLALKRMYEGLEVYVYVDGASDRTAELARAYEHDITLVVGRERRGKTHGMNRLVALVEKPIIMFTDATVTVDARAPERLVRYFADPEVGCVCGQLNYTNAGASVTAYTGSAYWKLEESIKRLESDTGTAVGADGSLFAVRRELHRAPPDDIIDDMYVSMMVFCEGWRVVQADDVVAFEESVTAESEEFARKVRIACQAFNVHRLLWSRIRRLDALSLYKYVSHKWMRWLTIYFLSSGLFLFELGLVAADHMLTAAILGAIGIACLVLGHLSRTGPFAQGWDILSAFAGTGLGVWRSMQGERFQTWQPAASIRNRLPTTTPGE
jgi:cellulose synthase/poly-beta-1,6-N-acetylglucosamine synthase-like glycosyltransferase